MDSISADLMSRAGRQRRGRRAAARRGRLGAGRQVRGDPRPARPLRQLADERRAPADGRRGQARGRARPVPRGGDREHPGQQDLHARPAGRRLGRRGRRAAQGHSRRARLRSSRAQVSFNTQVCTDERLPHLRRRRRRLLGQRRRRPRHPADNLGENWDGRRRASPRTTRRLDYKWSVARGRQARVRRRRRRSAASPASSTSATARSTTTASTTRTGSTNPGEPMTPQTLQGAPDRSGDFKTALFDVTQGTRVGAVGRARHARARDREPRARPDLPLHAHGGGHGDARRGHARQGVLLPRLRPERPDRPGQRPTNADAAPVPPHRDAGVHRAHDRNAAARRPAQAARSTSSRSASTSTFGSPELDWTSRDSFADLDQPDKRQFGVALDAGVVDPASADPAVTTQPLLQARGQLHARQPPAHLEDDRGGQRPVRRRTSSCPFEQWSGDEGYLKFGVVRRPGRPRVRPGHVQQLRRHRRLLRRRVRRALERGVSRRGPPDHRPRLCDVDYEGEQEIAACYGMLDLPLSPALNVIGGARFESTDISIVNDAEADATWFPPGSTAPIDARTRATPTSTSRRTTCCRRSGSSTSRSSR